MAKCIFDKMPGRDGCAALRVKACPGCHFYKSEEEYITKSIKHVYKKEDLTDGAKV